MAIDRKKRNQIVELKSLLDQPHKLPTIPKVAQQLIQSLGSDDVTIGEIAHQLVADPVLSAKLLRLANSAYFNLSRSIGSVDDALRVLGFVMVHNLVMGNSMAAAFRNTPGMNLKQFWRYNLYTASASRWLATAAGANGDLVFTVGLMHGIGQLQMHAGMPAVMAPLDLQINVIEAGRAELEQQALGFHYGDVSAEMAAIWKFPPLIISPLRNIPQPLTAPAFSEVAAWVHMGTWHARTQLLKKTDEELQASYPVEVAKRLGIATSWASTGMPQLTELSEGLEDMLG